jgi:hypothetical protein
MQIYIKYDYIICCTITCVKTAENTNIHLDDWRRFCAFFMSENDPQMKFSTFTVNFVHVFYNRYIYI